MEMTTARKYSLLAGMIFAAGTCIYFLRQDTSPPAMGIETPVGAHLRKSTAIRSRSSEAPIQPELPSESAPESEVILQSLENLAASDPKQALAKLGEITDPTLLSLALASVASGWATTDPQGAALWVVSLNTESQQVDAAMGLVPKWAESAPEDCLAWVSQCPLGNLREVSLVELADAWSAKHPQEAFARFLGLGSEDGTERGLQSIISQWSLDSPDAAVSYLSQIADVSRRDEFLQAALTRISEQNPELTWNYCDRLTDPETTEQTRSTALQAIAESHPQDAIRLAATAGNSELLLTGIARGWFSTDAAAAKAWITSLPDPEQVAKLLEAVAE